jgi:hypothetical protein
LEQKSSELEARRNELAEKEELICRIQKNSETEKLKLEDRIGDLERAKELLLDAKLELQNEVAQSGKEATEVRSKLDAANAAVVELKSQHEEQKRQMVRTL